jgi:hypothetical protein
LPISKNEKQKPPRQQKTKSNINLPTARWRSGGLWFQIRCVCGGEFTRPPIPTNRLCTCEPSYKGGLGRGSQSEACPRQSMETSMEALSEKIK